MTYNQPRLSGPGEADLAHGSGLRNCRSQIVNYVSDISAIVDTQAIGASGGSAVSSWTTITQTGNVPPAPGTLVVQISQDTATAATITFRVRGYDQFHNYIEEITPTVSFGGGSVTTATIYLAKVFVYVEEIKFQSTGLDSDVDEVSIGQYWDWVQDNSGDSAKHYAGGNLGIGILTRINRDVKGDAGGNQWREEFGLQPGTKSTGALTFTGQPLTTEAVVIGSTTYTFKSSIAVAYDVLIGSDAAESISNLVAAIVAGSGAGTTYHSDTVAHPDVNVASATATVLTVEANEATALGNLIATTTDVGNASWGGTTMSGGRDGPVEVQSVVVGCENGSKEHYWLTPTDYTIGYGESGWASSKEKLRILDATAVSAWTTLEQVLVSLQIATAETRV